MNKVNTELKCREDIKSIKINENDALEIIDLLKKTFFSINEISELYHISLSIINAINNGLIFCRYNNERKYPLRQTRRHIKILGNCKTL